MATYYVGTTSAGLADGSDWDNRFGDPNDYEDVAVAGDLVYFGAGAHRVEWTIDKSGSVGNPIVCVADVTGANTDGVGGIVRITGSDDDQTATRARAIYASSKSYRTFRGFMFDMTTAARLYFLNCDNMILEDSISMGGPYDDVQVRNDSSDFTFRRCVFLGGDLSVRNILFYDPSTQRDDTGHLVENCHFLHVNPIRSDRIGGVTVKNCTFRTAATAIRVFAALTVGQNITVNDCIVKGCSVALQATTTGEIVEDYNTFYANDTDRTNVAVGANSLTYPPLFAPPMLVDGFWFPSPVMGQLSEWSQVRAIAGTGEATDDLLGRTRPTTSAKKSWGAVQYVDMEKGTSDPYEGSAALYINDAGRAQMLVGVTAVSITVAVWTRWGDDYAGAKPQMIIKQPGQADRTVTATGSSGVWEQLADTFTPDAGTDFVEVEMVSNNTANSGDYVVEFDGLDVQVN